VGVLPITLFADFTSAISYLTEVAAWDAARAAGGELSCRACQLLTGDMPANAREEIRAAAEALGLRLDAATPPPSTTKAQEAARFARGTPGEEPFRQAIYQAHWGERLDIGRIDVLQDVAARVGAFDPVELRIALDIDRFRDDVQRDYAVARRLGISSMPVVYVGTGAGAAPLLGLISRSRLQEEIAARGG
jgi:predicted DsbA family dithiol-disulfide isomerase